jgi:tetratricopeptide (TPR) repeat protein
MLTMIRRHKMILSLLLTIGQPAFASTVPEWDRPLSAEEGRALKSALDREVKANRLPLKTLRELAKLVGKEPPTNRRSADEFVKIFMGKVAGAREFDRMLGSLEAPSASIESELEGKMAGPLQRARTAFNQGRFQEAEAAFESLAFLNFSPLEEARLKWATLVVARAKLAELQGNSDDAIRMLDEAAAKDRADARASAMRIWNFAFNAAAILTAKGVRLRDPGTLEEAIRRLRAEALLGISPELALDEWLETQNLLGMALLELSRLDDGSRRASLREEAVGVWQFGLARSGETSRSIVRGSMLFNVASVLSEDRVENCAQVPFDASVDRFWDDTENYLRTQDDIGFEREARLVRILGELDALVCRGERLETSKVKDFADRIRKNLTYVPLSGTPSRDRRVVSYAAYSFDKLSKLSDRKDAQLFLQEALELMRRSNPPALEFSDPSDWARTELNIGTEEVNLAGNQKGAEREATLVRARNAFSNGLRIFKDPVWIAELARAQLGLVRVGVELSATTAPEESRQFYENSIVTLTELHSNLSGDKNRTTRSEAEDLLAGLYNLRANSNIGPGAISDLDEACRWAKMSSLPKYVKGDLNDLALCVSSKLTKAGIDAQANREQFASEAELELEAFFIAEGTTPATSKRFDARIGLANALVLHASSLIGKTAESKFAKAIALLDTMLGQPGLAENEVLAANQLLADALLQSGRRTRGNNAAKRFKRARDITEVIVKGLSQEKDLQAWGYWSLRLAAIWFELAGTTKDKALALSASRLVTEVYDAAEKRGDIMLLKRAAATTPPASVFRLGIAIPVPPVPCDCKRVVRVQKGE